VRYSVAPFAKLAELLPPLPISPIVCFDRRPKLETEPFEIATEIARGGIRSFQKARFDQEATKDPSEGRIRNQSHDRVCGLGVDGATVALEVRQDQSGVGVVQLLCQDVSAHDRALDTAKDELDLVEGLAGGTSPLFQRH
jgi:hypothetical protein